MTAGPSKPLLLLPVPSLPAASLHTLVLAHEPLTATQHANLTTVLRLPCMILSKRDRRNPAFGSGDIECKWGRCQRGANEAVLSFSRTRVDSSCRLPRPGGQRLPRIYVFTACTTRSPDRSLRYDHYHYYGRSCSKPRLSCSQSEPSSGKSSPYVGAARPTAMSRRSLPARRLR